MTPEVTRLPAGSFQLEIDGRPFVPLYEPPETRVIPLTADHPDGSTITVTFDLREREARGFQRFVDSLMPPSEPRQARRRARSRRHFERPPTRGFWMKRCRCEGCKALAAEEGR